MPTDYFMKITNIPGDSTDAKHPNEIPVLSWSWGETMPESAGGGGGSPRVDVQDLHFTARTSKASPLLFLNCASGTHLQTAELTGRRAGGTSQFDYLKITLFDALISSYQAAGNTTDDTPLDQVSLYFAKIQITYTPQNAQGGAGTPIAAGWDVPNNKSF
ncbi:MAG: type VI secretion system tube protein Hcp [Chloroflexi bacterium]|nr:type VI secretion system tube protein Hcp [Chloroflexota bacterium]